MNGIKRRRAALARTRRASSTRQQGFFSKTRNSIWAKMDVAWELFIPNSGEADTILLDVGKENNHDRSEASTCKAAPWMPWRETDQHRLNPILARTPAQGRSGANF